MVFREVDVEMRRMLWKARVWRSGGRVGVFALKLGPPEGLGVDIRQDEVQDDSCWQAVEVDGVDGAGAAACIDVEMSR